MTRIGLCFSLGVLAAGCSLPHAELRGDSSSQPDITTDRPNPMDVADVLDVIDDVPTMGDAVDAADVVNEDAITTDVPDVQIVDVQDVQDVPDTGICPMGTMSCTGTCIDTATSNTNCGACGRVCADGLLCRAGDCVPALDCEELRVSRGIVSSSQMLDTDNDTRTPAVSVYCDISDGRGWTVVFGGRTADGARTFNFNSAADAAAQWSAPLPLAMRSSLVKFAYRDASSAVVDASNSATFSIPPSWRTGTNPFSQAADDVMVSVSIGGGPSAMRLLKFGYNSMFVRECGEGWDARNFGRVCIVGTTAPYFVAWANAEVDQCRNSDYTATGTGTMLANPLCGMDRRFTIALSR